MQTPTRLGQSPSRAHSAERNQPLGSQGKEVLRTSLNSATAINPQARCTAHRPTRKRLCRARQGPECPLFSTEKRSTSGFCAGTYRRLFVRATQAARRQPPVTRS